MLLNLSAAAAHLICRTDFARKIDGKLWELRVKSNSGIARAMYFTIHPQRAIILTAFVKKSQKLPAREHEKAEARMKSLQKAESLAGKRPKER
jgi:phage-related protein